MASAESDSVPLAAPAQKLPPALGLDQLFIMFLLFVTVNSDAAVSHFLSGVRGAVQGRYPTTRGVIVQGVAFVLLFCLITHLRRQGVL
jgi:hypothetical protein